jgi:hypothetical protein
MVYAQKRWCNKKRVRINVRKFFLTDKSRLKIFKPALVKSWNFLKMIGAGNSLSRFHLQLGFFLILNFGLISRAKELNLNDALPDFHITSISSG